MVTTEFATGSSEKARSISIQTDGKILISGYFNPTQFGPINDTLLARYNPNGTLDTTFGSGGWVRINPLNVSNSATDMVVQSDGKIVIVGYLHSANNRDMILYRSNIDGTLDVTFETLGYVVQDFGAHDDVLGVCLQSDGKILMAGTVNAGTITSDIVLLRYNVDGTPDLTFGVSGSVMTDFMGNLDSGVDVISQVDGKIMVTGWTNNPGKDFALIRYNPDGMLDTSFGVGGKVSTDIGVNTADDGKAIALQSDGKILIVGNSSGNIALARYIGAVLPVPDIKINGQDVALSLLMGAPVTVDISLLANDLVSRNSDVFVGVLTSNGNYWLRPSGNWVPGNPAQAYFTGPLTDIPLTNVLTYTLPWRGVYTFFIIVDAVGNNTFDNMSYVDTGLVIMGDTPPLALSHTAMQNEIKAKIRSLMTK